MFLSLSACISSFAQSPKEIMSDINYVWGEGDGATVTEAENQALAQMSRRISVSIFNMSSETDNNGGASQSSILQSISSAKFTNVQIRVLSEEPNVKVFCYMHKDEVNKMFESRKQHILDLVETGKIAESRLQIDDALRCYYWALVLANTNPHPITIAFGDKEGIANNLLTLKIKSIMQLLRVNAVEGEQTANRVNGILSFSYNGNTVSSVQFKYNDGQGIVGPIVVKDGIGEVEMLSAPANGKLQISYEYRFREEVDPLDGELVGVYKSGKLPVFDATTEIPFKLKGDKLKMQKSENVNCTASIAAQPTVEKKSITMKKANGADDLFQTVQTIENAISTVNPESVRNLFTDEGYVLFNTLIKRTGKVTLVGKSDYEFIESDGYILGRFTKIKIKYRNGKSFIENLVYRFNPISKKVESVAFALTKKGEADIMNASAQWPDISRWAILNFMEDYQTAFFLKRLDYINSIFSDEAIIITGTILKNINELDSSFDRSNIIVLDKSNKDVTFSKLTKKEYIDRLKKIFASREYVHLTFENNITKKIELPSMVSEGAAFGIEINQRYDSSGYSDEGYLTLVFDTRGKYPVIHVRLWQPDKTNMVSLQEFISKFSN